VREFLPLSIGEFQLNFTAGIVLARLLPPRLSERLRKELARYSPIVEFELTITGIKSLHANRVDVKIGASDRCCGGIGCLKARSIVSRGRGVRWGRDGRRKKASMEGVCDKASNRE